MLPLREMGDYISSYQMLIQDTNLEKIMSSEEFIQQQ